MRQIKIGDVYSEDGFRPKYLIIKKFSKDYLVYDYARPTLSDERDGLGLVCSEKINNMLLIAENKEVFNTTNLENIFTDLHKQIVDFIYSGFNTIENNTKVRKLVQHEMQSIIKKLGSEYE